MRLPNLFRTETPEEALERFRLFGKQFEIPDKVEKSLKLLKNKKSIDHFRNNECAVCDKSPAVIILWEGTSFVDHCLGVNICIPRAVNVCGKECLYRWLVELYDIPLTFRQRLQKKLRRTKAK